MPRGLIKKKRREAAEAWFRVNGKSKSMRLTSRFTHEEIEVVVKKCEALADEKIDVDMVAFYTDITCKS